MVFHFRMVFNQDGIIVGYYSIQRTTQCIFMPNGHNALKLDNFLHMFCCRQETVYPHLEYHAVVSVWLTVHLQLATFDVNYQKNVIYHIPTAIGYHIRDSLS